MGVQRYSTTASGVARQDWVTWDQVAAIRGGYDGEFRAVCRCAETRRTEAHRREKKLHIWRCGDWASFACAHCGIAGWVAPDRSPRRSLRRFTRASKTALIDPQYLVQARAKRVAELAFCEFIFFSAGPLPDSLAAKYLASRGLPADADDLRFVPSCPFGYESERTGPAMVAAIRDPSGKLSGLQATHLLPDGTKRRTTFGRIDGGAVRLRAHGDVLAVCEGTETGLGFERLEGLPTWATLGTSGLASFEPPRGLSRLVIAADHDANGAGLAAARKLAARVRARCDVAITMPRDLGDFADVLLRGRE